MSFFVLDLREDKPKIKSYSLEDTFNENKALFSSGISDVWQIKRDVLFIKCNVELSL